MAQRALPLLGQMRRTQHTEALDLPAIPQLARDEAGLDGLADADIISDEHAHRIEAHGEEQGDELVGAGLDGDAGEGLEGASGAAQREARGLLQQVELLKRAMIAIHAGLLELNRRDVVIR